MGGATCIALWNTAIHYRILILAIIQGSPQKISLTEYRIDVVFFGEVFIYFAVTQIATQHLDVEQSSCLIIVNFFPVKLGTVKSPLLICWYVLIGTRRGASAPSDQQ